MLHSRWSACVEEFQTSADETCWLDLDFKFRVCDKCDVARAHSVHLPHYGYDDDAYQLALDALTHSMSGRGQGPNRLHLIGMDANAVVGPVEQIGDVDHEFAKQDGNHFGPWGVGRRCRRGVVFLETARANGLAFASTFHYPGSNDGCTHVQWSSKSRSQIDFLLLPAKWLSCCVEVRVLPTMVCNSDHFAVKMSLLLPRAPADPSQLPPPGPFHSPVSRTAGKRAKQKPIGWKCKDLCSLHSSVLDKIDEAKTLDEFNCLVKECCLAASDSTPKQIFHGSFVDTYLAELLRMRRVTPDRGIRQELSKAIFDYRRRRSAEMQEERISKMLQSGCKHGRGKRHWPKTDTRTSAVTMTCNGVTTSNRNLWCSSLIEYFADIYSSRTDPQAGEGTSLPAANLARSAGPGPREAPVTYHPSSNRLAPLLHSAPSEQTPLPAAGFPSGLHSTPSAQTPLPAAGVSSGQLGSPAAGFPCGPPGPLKHSTPTAHSSRMTTITAEDVGDVIARTKRGKTCASDNMVSEMLQALPLDGIVRFAELLDCLLADASLPLPASWTELEAILLPKRFPRNLERLQADHDLPDARENLGLGPSC